MQRRQFDGDIGNGGGIRAKAPPETVEIGQSAGIKLGVDDVGEFGFASALVRQRQQPDHGTACPLLALGRQQRLKRALIGTARKELLAVDQVQERHRLAAQGVNDVPVINDMTVLAAGLRPAAAQLHQRRAAEKAFEPVIVQPHP